MNKTPAEDTQRLAEEVLLLLFRSGYRTATLRGCVSALHAVWLLDWLPPLRWERLWRLAKSPVAGPGDRPYAGPHILQVMAEACQSQEDWGVFAAAVMSFSSLARVSEIASVRRSGLRSKSVAFRGLKRDSRWVSRDLGKFAGEWAHWLRKKFPGREVLVPSSAILEKGMARMLHSSPYATYRRHSWRRAGASFLRFLGLPWRYLCWWGRWAVVRMAHFYAAAPDDFVFHHHLRLPWPTSSGVRWLDTSVREFWPESLLALCSDDEKPDRLTATGSKRTRGEEFREEADDSGDVMQPPPKTDRPSTSAKPSRLRARNPLKPKPPRRSSLGHSPPSGSPPSPLRAPGSPKPPALSSSSSGPPRPSEQPPAPPPQPRPCPVAPEDCRRQRFCRVQVQQSAKTTPPPSRRRALERGGGPSHGASDVSEDTVNSLLNSPRGQLWLDHVAAGLRVAPRDRGLVRARIRLLLLRGNSVAADLGMLDFIPAVLLALDALVPEVWAAVFRESTSPKPILVGLSLEVLDRGIGDIGHINIPSFIWHAVAPDDTLEIASRQQRNIRGISSEGLVMARALVRDGVLAPCQAALPPNGWLFPVPKNSEKASMIVHLVEFNRQHSSKPPSFSLPVVEDLASLIQLHFHA